MEQNMEQEREDGIGEVRWAPRVPQDKVRRLYESDARGLLDEELVDEVGYGLYGRCRSILRATEAGEGRVTCPRCGGVIVREGSEKTTVIHCEACGWQTTWGAYHKTYQGKQLHGGGAVEAFRTFLTQFDAARTARERLIAIDRLIHAWHWEQVQNPTRPAGANLIEGRLGDVVAFLDALSYGDVGTPGMGAKREDWYRTWQPRRSGSGATGWRSQRTHPSSDAFVNAMPAAFPAEVAGEETAGILANGGHGGWHSHSRRRRQGR